MPSKNRMTLFGHVELLGNGTAPSVSKQETQSLASCYKSFHPDTAPWLPGRTDTPHRTEWARFVVDKIYHVGGFGDEHFIGWIPVEKYRDAVRKISKLGSPNEASSLLTPDDQACDVQLLFGESVRGTQEPAFVIQA